MATEDSGILHAVMQSDPEPSGPIAAEFDYEPSARHPRRRQLLRRRRNKNPMPASMRDNHYLNHPELSRGQKKYLASIATMYSMKGMKKSVEERFVNQLFYEMRKGIIRCVDWNKYLEYITNPTKRKHQFQSSPRIWRAPKDKFKFKYYRDHPVDLPLPSLPPVVQQHIDFVTKPRPPSPVEEGEEKIVYLTRKRRSIIALRSVRSDSMRSLCSEDIRKEQKNTIKKLESALESCHISASTDRCSVVEEKLSLEEKSSSSTDKEEEEEEGDAHSVQSSVSEEIIEEAVDAEEVDDKIESVTSSDEISSYSSNFTTGSTTSTSNDNTIKFEPISNVNRSQGEGFSRPKSRIGARLPLRRLSNTNNMLE